MAKQYKPKEIVFDPNQLFFDMYAFYMQNKDNLHELTGEVGKVQIFNQGSGRCFAPDQMIMCQGESKKISELKIGDKVYSYDHLTGENVFKKVINVIPTIGNKKKCYNIKLKNGKEIKCTYDHKIFFKGRYITADKLVSLYKQKI